MATEWEDVLIAKGIIQPAVNHSLETQDETLNDVDLDELLADDDFMAKYTSQRLNQLKNVHTFAGVEEISLQDYEKQVTQASYKSWVVVFLYQNYIESCSRLSILLEKLSKQMGHVKFVKIQATRCIPNYPDKNVPTLIVYNQGNVESQLVGKDCGGENVSFEKLKIILESVGVGKGSLENELRDSDSD